MVSVHSVLVVSKFPYSRCLSCQSFRSVSSDHVRVSVQSVLIMSEMRSVSFDHVRVSVQSVLIMSEFPFSQF